VSAIVTAKLVPALQCTAQQCNPFTVFAPNNQAFANLNQSLLSYLLAHPPQLAQVLEYHLLDHRLYSTEIFNFEEQRTLDNEPIVFVVSGGKVLINGNSTVIAANVQAENGVVHISEGGCSGCVGSTRPAPLHITPRPSSLLPRSRHGAHPQPHQCRT